MVGKCTSLREPSAIALGWAATHVWISSKRTGISNSGEIKLRELVQESVFIFLVFVLVQSIGDGAVHISCGIKVVRCFETGH